MSLHFHAFSTALLISGVVSLLVALLLFQRIDRTVRWFARLMLCISIWAIAYAFELSSDTLTQMLFWIKLEYIGISFLPATWILFIITFVGEEYRLTKSSLITIFSFPALTLFFVWSNSWHHLYYESASVAGTGPFPVLNILEGPWYYVHTAYFYVLLALGTYLIIRKFKRADIAYKRQTRVLLIGVLIPWVVNFIYLLGWRPYNHIDLTPYAFIITSFSVGYGLLRYKLFDIIPLAREKMIEGMQEGVLVVDFEGRIIDVNPAMRKFLPRYLSDIVGEYLQDILPGEQTLHAFIKNSRNDKIEIHLKGGDDYHLFEVAITPIFMKRSMGTLLLFWDITERKRAEEKAKQQAEELTRLNQLKNQIFSIIAHDLRSPLASLVSILDMVEKGDISPDEFKALLPALSNDVGYTSVLLENLLNWSSSQMEGERVYPINFDLKSISSDKLSLFGRRASEKGIQVVDNIQDGTYALADKSMIDLVFRNIISNALKFSKHGDTVEISAAVEDNIITACIRDTGIGMDSDTSARIFGVETFSTRGTQNEKGTGLGLKLCKQFIEKNNGKLWVESEPGKGSKFFFTLESGEVI